MTSLPVLESRQIKHALAKSGEENPHWRMQSVKIRRGQQMPYHEQDDTVDDTVLLNVDTTGTL